MSFCAIEGPARNVISLEGGEQKLIPVSGVCRNSEQVQQCYSPIHDDIHSYTSVCLPSMLLKYGWRTYISSNYLRKNYFSQRKMHYYPCMLLKKKLYIIEVKLFKVLCVNVMHYFLNTFSSSHY